MARRRRRSFGALQHRGGSGTSVRSADREFSVRVGVSRNIGSSRANQYCAWAYLPKSGHKRTRRGMRGSDRMCASTPTKAAKKALRALRF
jgi:hypothetical protein